ncbi:MAG: Gfo/Idh/MocA family oxidoreductase [Chloroflexi bacterium]|nr:Gfo/Idh/MocA family oxidoreductase [Chloroflexota bacterium]MDA1174530.1 Gfo/Idh/MocA family oxidoreductase [Chloroflexota bacterium]
MADNVRIGIIGANPSNGWAGRAHMPGIKAGVPGITLTGVSTTRQESADEAAATFGAEHAFDDHRKMLERDDIDVAAVVVKLPLHYELAKDIIESGKNVYVEWPLGTNTAQAEELAALAKEKGVRTAVGLQGRRSAEALHIRKLIDEGYVGDVLSVDMTQFSVGGLARPSGRIWMRDKAAGANVLTIVFAHAVDTLMTSVGRFESLSAQVTNQIHEWTASDTGEKFSVDAPDDIRVIGTLKSGAAVSIHVGQVVTGSAGHRTIIHGTKGTLVLQTGGSPHIGGAATLSGAQGDDALAPIDVPQTPWVTANGLAGQSVNIGKLWAAYAESIQSGTADFDPDFDAAVEHHKFIDAVQRASDTGERQIVS